MDEEFKRKRKSHPRERANIFSLLSFSYTLSLFKRGYAKPLDEDDLYEVLKSCESKKLGDQLETKWHIEKKRCKNPSLYRVLWECFGKSYMILGLAQLVVRTIMVIAIPEALGKLVSYFSPGQTEVTLESAYLYAAIVVGFNFLHFIYIQNYMIIIAELGIRVRTAVCSLIYRKTLKMTGEALSKLSIGKIVTLITKDVHAFEMVVLFGNDIWIGLVQTVIIAYLAYNKVGPSAFVGIGFFFVLLPLQILIGKMSMIYRLKSSKETDARLQSTQETLSAIKIIKMYTWEQFFTKKISKSRKKEIAGIQVLFYLKMVIIILGALSTKLAFFLLIMTYVWLGHNVTAEIVYFLISCFGKLRHLLTILIPLGISYAAELVATNTRLSTILDAEEVPKSQQSISVSTNNPKIKFKEVSVRIKKVEAFPNTTIDIERGLNVIVGHIGCGKTTFLRTILQEYRITQGDLTVFGKISYASQEPWLFPSTIKNNILFGQEFDQNRYSKTLEVCALKYDLGSFPEGDRTIVGDHGLNLSKGQQARVNLARAIYKKSDIYLLDDCLAALDAHVSDFIFEECIRKFLSNKMVLFVTNNPEQIEKADFIISIDKNCVKYNEFGKRVKKPLEIEEDKNPLEDVLMLNVKNLDKSVEDDGQTNKKSLYHEKKKSGKVDMKTYSEYIRHGGGYIIFSLVLLLFVIVQGTSSYSEKLVSNWVTIEANLSNYKTKNLTDTLGYEEASEKRSSTLKLYSGIVISMTLISLFRSFCFFAFVRKASINLHKTVIVKILNATMHFFDNNFLGNVLNRFSKDLCTLDEILPFTMDLFIELFFILCGIMVLVCTVNLMFIIPVLILSAIAYLIRFVYQRTGRSLQRLDASTRGPLIGHVSTSLEGLTTIRAFKAQEIIKNEFDRHQDLYTSANYTLQNTTRALAFVLDGMCSVFIALVVAKFLLLPSDTSVGNVGLALSQAFHLTGLLQHAIKMWSDFENQMTSVERILEYAQVPQETKSGRKVEDWPSTGKIQFEKVTLTYNNSLKKAILKNLNFVINSKQKIGVVGRTGAGKSSIISSIFRLYEVDGSILIDGIDTKTLTLEFLRSKISIIPQDPVIFSGTIRDNLDPLKQYQDEEIWRVIKITKLDSVIDSLSDRVGGSDCDFSAGQKQLVCVARALIQKNRIVIMDEATANMDQETDVLINDVITNNFENCTVVIIAHRLSSVLNSDLVVVLNDGEILEMDAPGKLLENTNSRFYEMMVKQT